MKFMDDTYKSRMAHRIKSTRISKGLTQEEVSARTKDLGLEVKISRLQMWEIAHRAPKMDILPILAKALGTTAAYLACYTDVQGSESSEWRYIIPAGDTPENRAVALDFFALHVDQLRSKGFNERDILAITVRDKTVHPLAPGDAVFVDMSRQQINEPVLCAIRSNNNQVWLRYIKPEMHNSYTMYCHDKVNYPDKIITPQELAELDIIGQYIGHFHWEN